MTCSLCSIFKMSESNLMSQWIMTSLYCVTSLLILGSSASPLQMKQDESSPENSTTFECFTSSVLLDHGRFEIVGNGQQDGSGVIIRAFCNDGWRLLGDELHICDSNTHTWSGERTTCQDIDECAIMTSPSHSPLLLSNTTSHTENQTNDVIMQDSDITILDAEVDMPNSSDVLTQCHPDAICTNTPGTYYCQCPDHMVGDGYQCKAQPEVISTTESQSELDEEKQDSSVSHDESPVESAPCVSDITPQHAILLQKSSHLLTYSCHPDFSLLGTATLTCQNGNWSDELPSCVPAGRTCGDPGVPVNGWRHGDRFHVDAVLRFQCRKGLILQGASFVICQEDTFTWSNELPICTAKEYTEGDMVVEETIQLSDEHGPVMIQSEYEFPWKWLTEVHVSELLPVSLAPDGILDDDQKNTDAQQYAGLSSAPYNAACLASFICNDWLVTAASCLQTEQNDIIHMLDEQEIFILHEGVLLPVLSIYRHPRYFIMRHDHDVAVIKLKSPLTNQTTIPVLASKDLPDEVLHWSETTGKVDTLPVHSYEECPADGHHRPSQDSLCVKKHSTLPGAPLLSERKGVSELLGLAKRESSGFYTDLRKHSNWILGATEGCDL